MGRVTLQALRTLRYGGALKQAGTTFTATPSDARVLKALRWATNAATDVATTRPASAPTTAPLAQCSTTVLEADAIAFDPDSVEPQTAASESIGPYDELEQVDALPETKRHRRRYQRRDMTAAD